MGSADLDPSVQLQEMVADPIPELLTACSSLKLTLSLVSSKLLGFVEFLPQKLTSSWTVHAAPHRHLQRISIWDNVELTRQRS